MLQDGQYKYTRRRVCDLSLDLERLASTERRERKEPPVRAAAAHAATHSCGGAVDEKEESASTSGSMIISLLGCVVSAIIFSLNADTNCEGA